jgi:agmatine deiminase
LTAATNEVSSIVEAVVQFEPVTLIVNSGRLTEARQRLGKAPGRHRHPISFHTVADTVAEEGLDLWMRDIAPTFVIGQGAADLGGKRGGKGALRLHGIDFNFNGWGNRHPAQACQDLARSFLHGTDTERVQASIITEGGALETDGEGTLLATESSIVNENRNPGKSRKDIEDELKRVLGISKVLWVPGVKDLDTTDYHIDALARFARPGVVLLSRPAGGLDTAWGRAFEETRRILSTAVDANGRRLELVDISEPDPDVVGQDEEVAASAEEDYPYFPVRSYVNYHLVTGGIVVPQFGDERADASAIATLRKMFGPDRRAVGVLIKELPIRGGGIHCAAQQIPCVEI